MSSGHGLKTASRTEDLAEARSSGQFKLIDCPNCQGQGHGYGEHGFETTSSLVQVVPNCLICDANGKLVICYKCNKVSKYRHINIFDHYSDKICDNCHSTLTTPPPPKCQIHARLVQENDGTIKCAVCHTIFHENK